MFKKESKKLNLRDLKTGDVVWSSYFKRPLIFEEVSCDGEYLLKDAQTGVWFYLEHTEIEEMTSLMKELL